jgi:Methyltransferase domain
MVNNCLSFIEWLTKKNNFKTYLEIGVFRGNVFFDVSTPGKVAVDPDFQFGLYRKIKRVFRKISNLRAKFYKKTSDDFFKEDAPRLYGSSKVDICFVDGMHEFAYALRDIENTLLYLKKNGIILVHDCNPVSPADAVSFNEWKSRGYSGNWNGDVWKSILYLRTFRDDINVFVLDCDQGVGIITWGKPENKLSFTKEQINSFSYEDFAKNRQQWLNLKPAEYFLEFFKG